MAVHFSRLLRIFKLNTQPAFIIELEQNNQIKLYISYLKNDGCYYFESYSKTKLKNEFKDLSEHCLMSQCTDASHMLENAPITHFEADCSSLIRGYSMFKNSKLHSIKTEFPLLQDGSWMFSYTQIKTITIDFPTLENSWSMFSNSPLESITSDFPALKTGNFMFYETPLEYITSQFPVIINKYGMFNYVPHKLKQNYPQYFI